MLSKECTDSRWKILNSIVTITVEKILKICLIYDWKTKLDKLCDKKTKFKNDSKKQNLNKAQWKWIHKFQHRICLEFLKH